MSIITRAEGSSGRTAPDPPTVVLVHGAFAESASWNGVVAGLRDERIPVIAVANPLRGVRRDAAYVRSLLDAVDGDVVLVGHSYGGAVISNVSNEDGKVKGLVFVSAFAPDAGETAVELADRFPGSTLGQTLVVVKLPDGDSDLYLRQSRYPQQFAADVPAEDAALMAVTQRPISDAALDEPSGEPTWRTLPVWFLFGSEDRNIPVEAHRFMAERAGALLTVELDGGSHAVAVPEAAAVVDLVREAVAEVSARSGSAPGGSTRPDTPETPGRRPGARSGDAAAPGA